MSRIALEPDENEVPALDFRADRRQRLCLHCDAVLEKERGPWVCPEGAFTVSPEAGMKTADFIRDVLKTEVLPWQMALIDHYEKTRGAAIRLLTRRPRC